MESDKITGIHCPYCEKPMNLIEGNPVFTYWICKNCKKGFEYDIISEKIVYETEKISNY